MGSVCMLRTCNKSTDYCQPADEEQIWSIWEERKGEALTTSSCLHQHKLKTLI